MDKNLAAQLAYKYKGSLVHSGSNRVFNAEVGIDRLNDLLVKVSFALENQQVFFRAMLSKQGEDMLMLIQNRVTKNYILSGISGFLYEKPNAHGGLLSKLNSFYFHISLDHFTGYPQEIYFFGKRAEAYEQAVKTHRVRLLGQD